MLVGPHGLEPARAKNNDDEKRTSRLILLHYRHKQPDRSNPEISRRNRVNPLKTETVSPLNPEGRNGAEEMHGAEAERPFKGLRVLWARTL